MVAGSINPQNRIGKPFFLKGMGRAAKAKNGFFTGMVCDMAVDDFVKRVKVFRIPAIQPGIEMGERCKMDVGIRKGRNNASMFQVNTLPVEKRLWDGVSIPGKDNFPLVFDQHIKDFIFIFTRDEFGIFKYSHRFYSLWT